MIIYFTRIYYPFNLFLCHTILEFAENTSFDDFNQLCVLHSHLDFDIQLQIDGLLGLFQQSGFVGGMKDELVDQAAYFTFGALSNNTRYLFFPKYFYG